MCDYSLHAVNNRLAREGESLFVHRFPGGSKGLASMADLRGLEPALHAGAGLWARLKYWAGSLRRPGSEELMRQLPAVCVPPGARLYVEGVPEAVQVKYALAEAEEATFTQLGSEPFRYRDAIRFANGEEVLIQKFDEQTRVEILSLALAEDPEEEPEQEETEEPATVPAILAERRMSANA
jgi:hypothetical protein